LAVAATTVPEEHVSASSRHVGLSLTRDNHVVGFAMPATTEASSEMAVGDVDRHDGLPAPASGGRSAIASRREQVDSMASEVKASTRMTS